MRCLICPRRGGWTTPRWLLKTRQEGGSRGQGLFVWGGPNIFDERDANHLKECARRWSRSISVAWTHSATRECHHMQYLILGRRQVIWTAYRLPVYLPAETHRASPVQAHRKWMGGECNDAFSAWQTRQEGGSEGAGPFCCKAEIALIFRRRYNVRK